MANMLQNIYKGMKVYDQRNKAIGRVDYVEFRDEDSSIPDSTTSTISPIPNNTAYRLYSSLLNLIRK